MKIMGIDPGLRLCGYAIIEAEMGDVNLVEAGVLRINENMPMERRLGQIAGDIKGLLEKFNPQIMAVEDLYSHYAHPKTAILMGHARGVIMATACQAGISVESFAATKIKKSITGNGRASKQQVQKTIQMLLSLAELPQPADVADAIAVAICCGNSGIEV